MNRLILIVLVVAACSGPVATLGAPTQPPGTPVPVATPTAASTAAAATPTGTPPSVPPSVGFPVGTPPPGAQIVIATGSSNTLVTPDGFSLYTFDNDSPGASSCNGDCANNWPAFQTGGISVAGGEGVDGTFASITREDGTPQITYNDAPLYFFSGDSAPGDENGDGIGGVWHLAAP